jgi:hypothetical protein
VWFVKKEDYKKCWGTSMAFDTFVGSVLMENGYMCCILCDFNGKMFKRLDVLVVSLFF